MCGFVSPQLSGSGCGIRGKTITFHWKDLPPKSPNKRESQHDLLREQTKAREGWGFISKGSAHLGLEGLSSERRVFFLCMSSFLGQGSAGHVALTGVTWAHRSGWPVRSPSLAAGPVASQTTLHLLSSRRLRPEGQSLISRAPLDMKYSLI